MLHSERPEGHAVPLATHWPSLHSLHEFPQEPQLLGSLDSTTHLFAQTVDPTGQPGALALPVGELEFPLTCAAGGFVVAPGSCVTGF